jgi:lysozyme
VSHFQGDIDWNAVAKSGTKFAWIKATEGTDKVDRSFQANWNGAKAAGLHRGVYHVIDLCKTSTEQVAWFVKNVPVDPDAMPPALDLEPHLSCDRSLADPRAIADVLVMLTAMEHHYGKRPVLYTGLHYGSDYLKIWSLGPFKDYPLWVPRYSNEPPSFGDGSRPWQFWQYTDQGAVNGAGAGDRNVFYGSPQQWQDFLAAR